jgi:hypothetical protein
VLVVVGTTVVVVLVVGAMVVVGIAVVVVTPPISILTPVVQVPKDFTCTVVVPVGTNTLVYPKTRLALGTLLSKGTA